MADEITDLEYQVEPVLVARGSCMFRGRKVEFQLMENVIFDSANYKLDILNQYELPDECDEGDRFFYEDVRDRLCSLATQISEDRAKSCPGRHAVLYGSLVEGFEIHGPFANDEIAEEYADKYLKDGHYNIEKKSAVFELKSKILDRG